MIIRLPLIRLETRRSENVQIKSNIRQSIQYFFCEKLIDTRTKTRVERVRLATI